MKDSISSFVRSIDAAWPSLRASHQVPAGIATSATSAARQTA